MLSLLFAAGPIVLLIYLMTRRQALPSHHALPIAAVVVYLVRLIYFGNEPALVHASVVSGLLTAWTPILIVWGAILLFRTMEASGAMATVRAWLGRITEHPVAQLMIVGWAFAFMIEGASGFGTPAALAAPLLVGMGFPPLRVAVLTLVMNSVPVSFGAVGTPIWFGLGELEPLALGHAELLAISWRVGLLASACALVVPALALGFVVPWRTVARSLGFVALSVASCVLPMLALSLINYEFPALAGGMIGLLATVGLARRGVGLSEERPPADEGHPRYVADGAAFEEEVEHPTGGGALLPSLDEPRHRGELPAAAQPPEGRPASDSGLGVSRLLEALFPLWGVVLLLVVTRLEPLVLRDLLRAEQPGWSITLGTLGELRVSAWLVLQLEAIFGTDVSWRHELLYVPSIVPFFVVAAITWTLYRVPRHQAWSVFAESWRSLSKPIVALMAALVFVKLLMVEQAQPVQVPASTTLIGRAVADAFGGAWPLVAPFLGELGTFFSGSATVSNLTFGQIQGQAASALGLQREAVLAQQAVGAAMGNMVCIHNIVAVCSVLGLLSLKEPGLAHVEGPVGSVEGYIIKRTVIPSVLAGLLLGALGLLMQVL